MDLELRPSDDGPAFETVLPRRSRSTWIVVCVLLVVAAVAWYIGFRSRVPELATTTASAPPPRSEARPLGGDAAAITLPPLDESDGVVADLVRKLSSHPQVAAWLTTNGLIRNFTVVVSNVAEGKSPAKLLPPLRPRTPFRVVERDRRIYVDPRNDERYSPLADAVASIDAQSSASLYATLKPRIEEAHRELGSPDPSFDGTLERAIVVLLETPVRGGQPRLRMKGIGYSFADEGEEDLMPAQKQLLRMGAANARAVQQKLREIALALGIPSSRLPQQ